MSTPPTGSSLGRDIPIANVEQAQAWDGDEGDHWVRYQQRYDAMTRAFTEPLLSAAAIVATDRVLDIGCGNGQTTRLAARRASRGRAVGVDLSSAMLDRARQDAADEGLTNVRFERGDAQVHVFPPQGFDVVLSRFGVMFFEDPVSAFTNIGRALLAGGRRPSCAGKGRFTTNTSRSRWGRPWITCPFPTWAAPRRPGRSRWPIRVASTRC